MSQVWLITGASRGLGRRIAEAALAAGHRVAATARDADRLADLADAHGERVLTASLDVADPVTVQQVVARTTEHFGALDVVVNNAGQADFAPIEDTPAESFSAQIATNFWGVVHVTRAALPILREQGSGHFIQVSSLGARMGTPGLAAYQSAKAAVNVFSMSLTKEVGPLGIKVTIVEPGNLRTDILTARSMTMLPISEPYEQTVGAFRGQLSSQNGKQPGDPVRAAAAIIRLAGMPEPPKRVVLGSDALNFAQEAARELADSDDRWSHISKSIDFPDSTPAA
ncbi:SDR family NAD(P)-dependent oxidoreductase [Streptomyces sp. Inha503]|uniref:SDR family NAD(P)-dependent oxidoreductase n=1 Tax=Streptomyces sp. Inha503 TaxID=3383314 RepID=UPI0039A153D9